MNNRQKNWLLHRANRNSVTCDNGCINWTAAKNKGGYGIFVYVDEQTKKRHCVTVHRALFTIAGKVQLLPGQRVFHSCGNPSCVNVDHLTTIPIRAKTYRKHSRSRVYSDDQIREMRSATGKLSYLSTLYGVSQGYLSKLRNGKAKRLVS